jgi:hypothetical protein
VRLQFGNLLAHASGVVCSPLPAGRPTLLRDAEVSLMWFP